MLQVPHQQVLDAVLGVAGPAAAPVLAADHPAAHVAGHLHGQVHDVEQVHGDLRARQHPAHRAGVDAAHVDRHDPDRVPPARGGPRQPVRGVISGAALHLAQQPLLPGQVEEAGVPPVREQQVLPGLLVTLPAGPAAAVLVDAQVRHRRGGLLQHRVRRGGERLVRHRPGDPGVPGRLRRGDPALGDLGPGLLPQPRREPAPRRHLRQPLGERLAAAAACSSHFQRRLTHHTATWSRPGGHPAAGPAPCHAGGPRPSRSPGTPPRPGNR